MAVNFFVGGEFFDEIRQTHAMYVDKTELLYELAAKTNNKVTLFTRPRRFGKTLTMTMMESFFDMKRDSSKVFEGLNVTKHEEFCKQWMNQYPVLFLTLKDVEGLNFEDAYAMLVGEIAKICIRHASLEQEKNVLPVDSALFHSLMYKEANKEEVRNSLLTLTRMMNDAFGKPVILLIDEYDVPLAKAQENGYYREMLDVMRGLMSTALKTNPYLKFAVVTGCLRISRESIFTGVNHFASYSVLDEDFSQYFGFTQKDVDDLLEEADLTDKRDLFKEWYDGYIFGSTPVYGPWDVVRYAADLMKRRDAKPMLYWKGTSGNGILKDFLYQTELDLSADFETLMNGGTIRKAITDQLAYDSLYESADSFWSVLLMTGYLTKADPRQTGTEVDLRIPNAEIDSIFEETVVARFHATLDKNRQVDLMKSMWEGNAQGMQDAICDFLWDTISYHNYHEDFYQAFIAGIFAGVGYVVKTDSEQGLGRSDILVTDRRGRRAVIMEAKKSDREADMEKDCREASSQILKKKYADALNGYRQVLCYGVAFFQKSALVRKLEA